MEENQELRFVCKLCNKRCSSGKSLGGHMRSHSVTNITFESEINKTGIVGQSNKFGLRDSVCACKQCGKGFQSLKALCGHMACHSDRDKGILRAADDHSWTSEGDSDTETEDRIITTRSSRTNLPSKNNNHFPTNGSSSVSEIDGGEQEELALCLMMLSKDDDIGNKGYSASLVESSDNNSVVLETIKGLKDRDLECENEIEDDSDSGYFLDECAKFNYRSIHPNAYFSEVNRPCLKREWRKGNGETCADKKSKYECYNCKRIFKSYQALGGHRPCHKRSNDLDEASGSRKAKAKKNNNKAHACPFCDRVFKNGQAFGGHKRSHFIGGRGATMRMKSDLLDLNLPAPEVGDDSVYDQ